jgi:hypothetical protein
MVAKFTNNEFDSVFKGKKKAYFIILYQSLPLETEENQVINIAENLG